MTIYGGRYEEPPDEEPSYDYDELQPYPGEETWADAGPRKRWGLMLFGAVAAALVFGMCGVGVVLAKGRNDPTPPRVQAENVDTSPLPPLATTPYEAVPSAPPPTATSAAASRPAKATPSKNPKATEKPPPAPPPAEPPGCQPTVQGTAASYADVRAALKVSARHTYWASVPTIRVPERLLIAVAMTESTWRSNVVACDGGIGLMQVMPNTVTQINNRFGTSWKVNTLQGNAHLGGNYLAWSVRYFGDLYFGGSYDLGNQALLDAVISAYNYGAGAVDPTKGEAGIPNWSYVNRVKQYMASCPCDAW